MLGAYAAKVRSFVSRPALRPLKVVADTANGMGGLVVPAVFAGLPFELEILFGELDGTFPNHPADPIQPENLVALQRRILETGADVGLAFDGDADRCFLVDDQGVPLSGSTTTALVAAAMLEKHPGATILHNLICSKAVPEIIRERGGVPVRTRVGHSYIKAIMADTDAIFGGEHSGHYYFRDNYRADSGLDRRPGRAGGAVPSRPPAVRAAHRLRALRGFGRDQHRGGRPGCGDRGGRQPLPGSPPGPPGRPDGRPRGVVVQPAALQHRAAAPAQPGSGRPRDVLGPDRGDPVLSGAIRSTAESGQAGAPSLVNPDRPRRRSP